MKIKRLLGVISIILCCCSCNHSSKEQTGTPVLKVDLDAPVASLNALFRKTEVIPLETSDSCLVVTPADIQEYNNIYYLYDIHTSRVLAFDAQGKFLYPIGHKGQGPGEYVYISDFSINKQQKTIYLLDPIGIYYCYTLDGKFIQQNRLMSEEHGNYNWLYSFHDKLLTFSFPRDKESYCISIIRPEDGSFVGQLWNNHSTLLNHKIGVAFYSYQDKTYFTPALFDNEAYEITPNEVKVAYRWDFGKNNINLKGLGLTYEEDNYGTERTLLSKAIENQTIPYLLISQNQNDKYYNANLYYGYKIRQSIFYRKSDGKSFIIGKKENDIQLRPFIFTDEYIVCAIEAKDYEKYQSVLNEKEYQKLMSRTEDDNPCLVKFYFK
ncbi:6-bladed beta-propeller [Phocaeicola sp.]